MSSSRKSNKDRSREIVKQFLHWFNNMPEKEWVIYINKGSLNRSEIASTLKFARSTFNDNQRLKRALRGAEARLRASGIISSTKSSSSEPQLRDTGSTQRRHDAQRTNRLEAQNADLRSQLQEAKNKLKSFSVWEDYLKETGRMPRP